MFSIIGLALVILSFVLLIVSFFIMNDTVQTFTMMAVFVVFIVGGIMLFCGLISMSIEQDEKNRDGCKDVGGRYVVVDQQWTGKVYVDVYGCVKE